MWAALEPVIEAILRAVLPMLFAAAKDTGEIAAPNKELNDLFKATGKAT